MTKETLKRAKECEAEIKKAKEQIQCIIALDKQSSYYEGDINHIPVGGMRIDVPGTNDRVNIPKELKHTIITLLQSHYRNVINEREEELESL